MEPASQRRRRGRQAARPEQAGPAASLRTAYRNIRNTLPRATAISDDEVEAIHQAALRVLQELGIKVLLPEARELLAGAGAIVDDDELIVRIGADIVTEALATAPGTFDIVARDPAASLAVGGDNLMFSIGAGCPNINDLDRGRRPGSFDDFVETTRLQHICGIVPKLGPSIEPQDVAVDVRHLAMTREQMVASDKVPFVYARGRGQTEDCFEIVRLAHGVDEDAFISAVRCFTVINTNSPRQLDIAMSQGIIDFARAGQASVITPFCLAGAMAPVTLAGALTLSHAEALAGIALAQIARPGAPVVYGAFLSNVDMRSGAPVFGTPEHIRANFAAGQLARRVGLPWRSAAGTAAASADVQAAYENQLALWGAVLAGANMIYHAMGWLEGGLTFSWEKFITDMEVCRIVAEAMAPVAVDEAEIGFEAIAGVQPGGHFFAAPHTMERYRTAFYEPLASDWSNFGQWESAGSVTATERANAIWKELLAGYEAPPPPDAIDAIEAFVARRREEGGAPPA